MAQTVANIVPHLGSTDSLAVAPFSPLQRFPSTELEIDPMETPDLVSIMLSYLDTDDLFTNTMFVNTLWHQISLNPSFWQQFCNKLWKGKFYITKYALNFVRDSNYLLLTQKGLESRKNQKHICKTVPTNDNDNKHSRSESLFDTINNTNNDNNNNNPTSNRTDLILFDSDDDNNRIDNNINSQMGKDRYDSSSDEYYDNDFNIDRISVNRNVNDNIRNSNPKLSAILGIPTIPNKNGKNWNEVNNDNMDEKEVDEGNESSNDKYSPFDAYFISKLDCERNVITFDELTSIEWNFEFKSGFMYYQVTDDGNDIILTRFKKDYTMQQNPQFHGPFVWKFLSHEAGMRVSEVGSDLEDNNRLHNWGIIDYLHLFDSNIHSTLFGDNPNTKSSIKINPNNTKNDVDTKDSNDIMQDVDEKKTETSQVVNETDTTPVTQPKRKDSFQRFKQRVSQFFTKSTNNSRDNSVSNNKNEWNDDDIDSYNSSNDSYIGFSDNINRSRTNSNDGNKIRKKRNHGLSNEQLRKVRLMKKPDGKLNHARWIQVNQYPPLCVFRDKNWGFVLENSWVRFTSF